MSFELVHASVQRGLRGGSGFATAVATRGMPPGLERALEELSAYDFDAVRSVGADRVDWSHRILTVQGRTYSVLSRIAPCGNDWSGRPNRIAHHVVLDAGERAAAGPAWMLARIAAFAASASEAVPAVEERPRGPQLPVGALPPRVAGAWTAAGFDAGWAGLVARMLLDHASAPCYLVLPAETDTLPLLEDVFALIPEDRRWHATFSTRFQRASAGAKCQVRCVRAGAPALPVLLAEPGTRHLTIDRGMPAGEAVAADAGRMGYPLEVVGRTDTTRVQPVLRGTADPRAGAPVRSATSAADASRSPSSAVGDASAPHFGDLGVPGFAQGRPRVAAETGRGAHLLPAADGRFLAYVLFGAAGAALIASLVLALLIVFRG